jgi:hypothetical protein
MWVTEKVWKQSKLAGFRSGTRDAEQDELATGQHPEVPEPQAFSE